MTWVGLLNEHIKESGQGVESILERKGEQRGSKHIGKHSLFKGQMIWGLLCY